MPSGNGARAAQKRERNQAKAASATSAHSQLKVNAQSMNIMCAQCRQPFMSTTKEPELRAHHANKHSKVAISACFPNLS